MRIEHNLTQGLLDRGMGWAARLEVVNLSSQRGCGVRLRCKHPEGLTECHQHTLSPWLSPFQFDVKPAPHTGREGTLGDIKRSRKAMPSV